MQVRFFGEVTVERRWKRNEASEHPPDNHPQLTHSVTNPDEFVRVLRVDLAVVYRVPDLIKGLTIREG
jgi:hypothetical protein